MTNCLEVNNLGLSIRNEVILNNISFQVPSGKITALVGHNGAGKSTTMKAIMGWQEKSEGEIKIKGISQDDDFLQFKTLFSYIPEEPLLMSELTVEQHFQLYGSSYLVSEQELKEKITYYTEAFDIRDKRNEFPELLSKGMRQKVQTICALIPDVPLLLIDEPFMGLDIYAAQFLMEELAKKKENGTSILITTHQLEKVTDLCDEFVLLSNGQIAESGQITGFNGLKRRKIDE
ncbi:ABC-2 type transport system ATP-binding protein [Salirhabdus euzebyi]|uniref:ABC-2 type transport system ATP-binding protein n=1 Tax=Salirhabdus euzebyi TaxID=394506 RepID=A0A841Q6Z3_9BACI|nr:ABC transporter ATP-binding protein [Salirhabdus euzebyi]MBB6454176.1 ABC-2 type transport system ATP-binding protein [Salirhabdus euzebyi]